MERQVIHIPDIVIEWSAWTRWSDLLIDSRAGLGVRIPNNTPGVYEVRLVGSTERLTIGKASDLRMRIKQGLVKGKTPHSTGIKIRANEVPDQLEVRWAVTDRPAAVEEELHSRYREAFGRFPKYTQHT
jgi:hypothetical protein